MAGIKGTLLRAFYAETGSFHRLWQNHRPGDVPDELVKLPCFFLVAALVYDAQHMGKEIVEKKISTVNMLGCHDGIPLLDLKGLLLASLDILAGSLSEDQLALGVDVDLGDAQADGLCDHVVRDARRLADKRNS